MSFKSKQRAKHGHLFGDDPLNAALVSTSDDPLFAPTKNANSQNNKINSSNSNDPLSHLIDRNNVSLDSSNSTPVSTTSSPRRSHSKMNGHSQNSNSSSSLFGDIDVSKLGTGNGVNRRVSSSTSLRSTATLKIGKQFDIEDEEDLLFGSRRYTTRPKSINNNKTSSDSIKKSSTNVEKIEPATSSTAAQSLLQNKVKIEKENKKENETKKLPISSEREDTERDERPISSASSSFFRFFKSSNNNHKINSKSSSKASSIISVNATSPTVNNNDITSKEPSSPITSSTTLPTETIKSPLSSSTTTTTMPDLQSNKIQSKPIINENSITEEEYSKRQPMIEDEATRAFANDVISFEPIIPKSDFYYRAISPELTMDVLHITDTNTIHNNNTNNTNTNNTNNNNKRPIMTSISTPTTMLTNNLVEDPWSEIPIISKKDLISKQSPSHQDNFVPGMSSIEVPIITTEPSISSPLIVKTQDIEPQKRRAFADLIASWNTGQRNKNIEDSNHSHQFFEHIAEESRDIGFAGIEGNKDNTSHSQNQVIPPIMDWTEEENPWN